MLAGIWRVRVQRANGWGSLKRVECPEAVLAEGERRRHVGASKS